jgi:mevalonate kinase
MKPTFATAPGKVILFGEHAVVYGRPAIAVPVTQVRALARVEPAARGAGLTFVAVNLERRYALAEARRDDPLAEIVRRVLVHLKRTRAPDAVVTLDSSIPIAGGMGSGAACSTAIARALSAYLNRGRPLDDDTINDLVYQVEKLHHGTPSGIDNTVIAYNRLVYFKRGELIQTFNVPAPFQLAVADTGIRSPTKIAVGDVRKAWEAEPARYERLFDSIGTLAHDARLALEEGAVDKLGWLMHTNHVLLRQIGVSCPELDALAEAAEAAGSAGAKLSGGGRGGNLIALVNAANVDLVKEALLRAGAKSVMVTMVGEGERG